MINDMIANSENNELKSTIPCSICGERKHPEETAICEVCVNCL